MIEEEILKEIRDSFNTVQILLLDMFTEKEEKKIALEEYNERQGRNY